MHKIFEVNQIWLIFMASVTVVGFLNSRLTYSFNEVCRGLWSAMLSGPFALMLFIRWSTMFAQQSTLSTHDWACSIFLNVLSSHILVKMYSNACRSYLWQDRSKNIIQTNHDFGTPSLIIVNDIVVRTVVRFKLFRTKARCYKYRKPIWQLKIDLAPYQNW